jgi:Ca-activated chloride channel family protein
MDVLSVKYVLERPFLKASEEEAFGNPLLIEVSPPDVGNQFTRLSQNICIVLDRSGSMDAEGKIDFARDGACEVVDRLSDNDYFSLVVFNEEPLSLIQSVQCTTEEKDKIKEIIKGVSIGGGTNISDALKEALNLLKRKLSSETVSSMILLSDGQPNAGFTNSSQFEPLVKEIKDFGINIHSYGLGGDHDASILSAIGGGEYKFVTSPNEIPELFGKSFAQFENVVVKNLKLEIQLADRKIRATPGTSFLVKPKREFLKTVNLDPQSWTITFLPRDLERGVSQSYLIQLYCPPNPQPGVKKLATIKLTFDIPSQNKFNEEKSLDVNVEYTNEPSKFNKRNIEVRYTLKKCIENKLTTEINQALEEAEKEKDHQKSIENKAKALHLLRQLVEIAKEIDDKEALDLAQSQITKLENNEEVSNAERARLQEETTK